MNFGLTSKHLIKSLNRISSLAIRGYRKGTVKEGCECPEPPKVEKTVQEKSCDPCIFKKWKPKARASIEAELCTKKKSKPVKCFAGMVIERPFSDCKDKEIDPFKKKACKGPPKQRRPPPPVPPPEEIKTPIPDWDMDCRK